MARTQINGDQILDNSVTSADIADNLELGTLYVSSSLTVAGQSTFDADTLELTGSLLLNGNLRLDGSAYVSPRIVTGSYTRAAGDYFVALDIGSSGSQINLGTGEFGQLLILKDVSGKSSDHPVRIIGSVDGLQETWLSSSYASLALCWTGARWSRI